MENLKLYYCTKFQRECPDPIHISCDGWERIGEERLMCLYAEESSVLEEKARHYAKLLMTHLSCLKLNPEDLSYVEEEIVRHMVEFGREILGEGKEN